MTTQSAGQPDDEQVQVTRIKMLRLLAANPNYFGTLPGLGFEAVEKFSGNTTYEELGCVSYSPERDRLEATIQLKRPTGYSGPLCSAGSFEHVRFWVDYGSGWTDAGVASVNVHDIPTGADCAGRSWHPLSYVVGVNHDPHRRWCFSPVLPKIRAILSWGVVPPSTPPPATPADWQPIWGDVKECTIQVRPRRFWFTDIVDLAGPKVAKEIISKLPPHLLAQPVPGAPDPGPLTAVPLPELAKLSKQADVPAHRFALPHLDAVQAELAPTPGAFALNAQIMVSSGIDPTEIYKALEQTSGNVTYEELTCLGLDEGFSSLVATFVVKRSTGYSGGPCTQGSTEYVAFWADWDDDCQPTYLDTVKVSVHDYPNPGMICYAAVLPVNLAELRRPCGRPLLSRVRAVLSWGVPPSTTDPDAVPYWGNRIDRHVQIAPGLPLDGTARFDHVGGVQAQNVSLATGLTQFAGQAPKILDGPVVAVGAAFAGEVRFHGPADPALAGKTYRLVGTSSGGSVRIFTDPFYVDDIGGITHLVTPGVDGSATWMGFTQNKTGLLGHFTPSGDERWTVHLELWAGGAWNVYDTAVVQLDSTVDHLDLQLDTAAQCKIPAGPLDGTLTASDLHFQSWSIQVLGTVTAPVTPVDPATSAVLPANVPAPPPGTDFRIDLSGFASCGYVVRLWLNENVIVSSTYPTRSTPVDRGICIE